MYDVAILGGGIIGLATGFELLTRQPHKRIIIIEKEVEVAQHQTGNNSGVIHTGIYYKPRSLKAINCRHGVNKLLKFCDNHNIKYELCGKLIIATSDEEIPRLIDLYKRGKTNGVPDLKLIKKSAIRDIEPFVNGVRAIHSPSTGIIDYKKVCITCVKEITKSGGRIQLNSQVVGFDEHNNTIIIKTTQGDFEAKQVINCTGLYADRIASKSGVDPQMKIIPFRGEYYSLKPEKQYLVKNLIYPVPDPKFPFLGVHFTRKIDGSVEAGPNAVLAFAREGYRKSDINIQDTSEVLLNPSFWKLGKRYWKIGSGEIIRSMFKSRFTKALQKLIPELHSKDLVKGGSGVRAQALDNNGNLLDDFRIVKHGNITHVLNAPSPAATSAFAIAEQILANA